MSIFFFILILIVLILVHEFGHFIVAKAFGIRVDEFGIFFPPRLFGVKWGETTYTLNALPFGGFVKIYGEDKEAEVREVGLLQGSLTSPDAAQFDTRSFVHKSRWIQAAVILAGILFNILFAWVVLSLGYMIGMQSSVDHIGVGEVQNAKVVITAVLPKSPAESAGLKPNDAIVSLQTGTDSLPQGADTKAVQAFISKHDTQSIIGTVIRDGTSENFLAKPADGFIEGRKALGIELDDVGILKLNPALALVQGAIVTKQLTVETAKGLAMFLYTIVRGEANFAGVAGPIGIVNIGSSAVKSGIDGTIFLTALISINLAIINLLPIPGLDGGRLLFIVIEGIRGKPIKEKTALRVTIVGYALLITLILVISYHDIIRLVHPV